MFVFVRLSPKEILENAYEYALRCDILFSFESNDLTEEQATALLQMDTPLNDIVQTIENERKAGKVEFVFVEAALFIEAGYKAFADSLWYIYVPKNIRVLRLKESRGYSDEKISDIMKKQLQEETFLATCDVTIDNSRSLDDTMLQVEKALCKYEIM